MLRIRVVSIQIPFHTELSIVVLTDQCRIVVVTVLIVFIVRMILTLISTITTMIDGILHSYYVIPRLLDPNKGIDPFRTHLPIVICPLSYRVAFNRDPYRVIIA